MYDYKANLRCPKMASEERKYKLDTSKRAWGVKPLCAEGGGAKLRSGSIDLRRDV